MAHPDASQPERVRITNTKSGVSIPGALFRREREFPGPRIQISSNAAAALGILAGQPTELEVIALRRETVVIQPAPAPISDEVVENEEAAEATAAVVEESGKMTVDAEPVLTPAELRRQKRQEAAAKRKAEREAARKAREEKREAARLAREEELAREQAEKEAAEAEAKAAALAAAEKDASKPTARPAQDDALQAAADAIEAAEAPVAAPAVVPAAPKPPTRPFLQLGTYKTLEEADEVSMRLRAAGLFPTVVERRVFNQTSWRVIVGPAATQEQFEALQARLTELGYDGVKPVRR